MTQLAFQNRSKINTGSTWLQDNSGWVLHYKSLLTASFVLQLRGFICFSSPPCASELLFMVFSSYWPNTVPKLSFYSCDYSFVLLAHTRHNSVFSSLSFLTAGPSSASLACSPFTPGSSIMYYFMISIPQWSFLLGIWKKLLTSTFVVAVAICFHPIIRHWWLLKNVSSLSKSPT